MPVEVYNRGIPYFQFDTDGRILEIKKISEVPVCLEIFTANTERNRKTLFMLDPRPVEQSLQLQK